MEGCSLADAVEAWNAGFTGYYFNAATTADAMLRRMVQEELSPHLSLIAYHEARPVGIVLGGVRLITNRKVGWNGGTGVAPDLRGKGTGKLLMEAHLDILREEGAESATLEAILANDRAISLYQKVGYRVIDELEHLSLKGKAQLSISAPLSFEYRIERLSPDRIDSIPFYKSGNPWQTHWQSAREGEAIVVFNGAGAPVGYAYSKRVYTPEGRHESTVMHQCETALTDVEGERVIRILLDAVFGRFEDDINRVIPNVPKKASAMTGMVLKKMGFETVAEQVQMVKDLAG